MISQLSDLPRGRFSTHSKTKKVEVEIELNEYCVASLLVLLFEQHKYFVDHNHTLITGDTLKHSDILASESPFYNESTQLLHEGGMIGMGASGRRGQEFLQIHPTKYKMVLPHKTQLASLMLQNACQRRECSSSSVVRLILND